MDDFHLELDPQIEAKVGHLPEILENCLSTAEDVAERARSRAPVETGEYAASIQAQATKSGARVFAADYKSAWIEFGVPSQGQPARFVLRNAAESAGLTFKKRGG